MSVPRVLTDGHLIVNFFIFRISCIQQETDFKRKPFLLSANLYDIIRTVVVINFFNVINKIEESFHYVPMGSDKEKS